MTVTQILQIFSNKDTIDNLTFSEKMIGVGITLFLGMGLTFLVLIILKYMIEIVISNVAKQKKNLKEEIDLKSEAVEIENSSDNDSEEREEEIVAAISAAIILQLGEKNRFVVKNIIRVLDETPTWSKIGLVNQMLDKL
ncbi:OadG family protein [Cetobacterium sp.]|uniref:OadG family protein n=1 Tax=Cetobacterium sp. TaxID=2071632 RepID=UPI003AF02EA0